MSSVPLVIDLDRALLHCDLALESVFGLFREEPLRALTLLARLAGSRGSVVRQLERDRQLDVSRLPYNTAVLTLIEAEKAKGRQIVLSSAHYSTYARQIAEHLRIFDRVVAASDLGPDGFERVEPTRSRGGQIAVWAEGMRLHQWIKNVLLFVPLLTSHRVSDAGSLRDALFGFVFFGLCASSVYLLNDLIDLPDDRQHPTKRFRPFASGRISIAAGLTAVPILLASAFVGAWLLLPPLFTVALGAYYVITFIYSFAFKRVMMLDVVTLAVLYTLRIVAGACAIGGELTFWLLGFSMFIFVSLALAKRYKELREASAEGESASPRGRGYVTADLGMISALGAASGYLSVMVLALYIQDPATAALYRHPRLIWFACPLLLFWVGRTWMITHRGKMHDDPVVFAITDRVSLLTGALFGLIFSAAA